MMITKGDLFDQERKVAQSGLGPHFAHIEVVSAKTLDVYRTLLARYKVAPRRFLMVGNSLRSDILPTVTLGGHAVHIPYHIAWAHEEAVVERDGSRGYVELEHMGLLPAYVERLCRRQT
jgi:putative hydrolase of the HAD superfamily